MLNHPTLEQLRQLKLEGIADAFVHISKQDAMADLSHAEWLGLLVEREVASRNTRRFQTRTGKSSSPLALAAIIMFRI